MWNILKKHHGMSLVGQGGKIIVSTLPSLIAAVLTPQQEAARIVRSVPDRSQAPPE